MYTLLVLFGKPADRARFDLHFEQEHFQLLTALPGLRNVRTNRIVGAIDGKSAFYVALELGFDNAEALQDGLNSDHGQAMAKDYGNFATGGVDLLVSHLETSPLNAH